jgi:hypothetical protein
MGSLLLGLGIVGWLQGCAAGPVFVGVTEVTLNTQTASGIHKNTLEGDRLKEAVACLEGQTTEIAPEAQNQESVLQEILLMGVKDKFGDRMFELTTTENFSGNKGKFYKNACIYRLVRKS